MVWSGNDKVLKDVGLVYAKKGSLKRNLPQQPPVMYQNKAGQSRGLDLNLLEALGSWPGLGWNYLTPQLW